MRIYNKLVTMTAAVVLFGAIGFAQQSDEKQKQEQDRQRTAPSTMTGCLTKSDTAGQYAFIDASGTKRTVVASSGVDLDKHSANHTVKLTGTLSDDGKTLTATNVEHVSETCDATK